MRRGSSARWLLPARLALCSRQRYSLRAREWSQRLIHRHTFEDGVMRDRESLIMPRQQRRPVKHARTPASCPTLSRTDKKSSSTIEKGMSSDRDVLVERRPPPAHYLIADVCRDR
jgi:hypothetical protein